MRLFFSLKMHRVFQVILICVMISFVVSACAGAPASNNKPTESADAGKGNAQDTAKKEPKTVAEIAMYEGPNRDQRLVEAAKKEGQITIYSTVPVEDMEPIIDSFQKKYGTKVDIWRGGSQDVLNRVLTEARAKRNNVDVIVTSGPELEALHREKMLQEVKSPYLNDLIPEAIPPHKEWIAAKLNVFVLGYNTKLVKKEEIPKSWSDLLDTKWKGRLGVEAEDVDWFAQTVKVLGEEKGLKLFRDIVATNGLFVRKGHTLLTNLVASGEVPLAFDVFNNKAEQLKEKGAALDWFTIDPAIARPSGLGVTRTAPHPNAAVLFYDFMITDAQEIFLKRDYVPTSKKIDTPLNKIKMQLVEPAVLLDENEKWNKLFDEIIVKQSGKK